MRIYTVVYSMSQEETAWRFAEIGAQDPAEAERVFIRHHPDENIRILTIIFKRKETRRYENYSFCKEED